MESQVGIAVPIKGLLCPLENCVSRDTACCRKTEYAICVIGRGTGVMSDEVLEGLWESRRQYEEDVGGSLAAVVADIRRSEKHTSARLVDRSKRRRPPVSTKVADKVAEAPADYGKGGE